MSPKTHSAAAQPTANESRAADVLRALDDSPLSGPLREDLRDIIRETEAAANGIPLTDKIRALSQGVFDLARIMIYNMIHDAKRRPRSWRDVVVECRREACIIAAILAALLLFRPEIAALLSAAR